MQDIKYEQDFIPIFLQKLVDQDNKIIITK